MDTTVRKRWLLAAEEMTVRDRKGLLALTNPAGVIVRTRARRPRHWLGLGLLLAVLAVLAGTLAAVRARPMDPVERTTAVGHLPCCVAADGRTRHVFVVNSGDNTVTVLDARSGAPCAPSPWAMRLAPSRSTDAAATCSSSMAAIAP